MSTDIQRIEWSDGTIDVLSKSPNGNGIRGSIGSLYALTDENDAAHQGRNVRVIRGPMRDIGRRYPNASEDSEFLCCGK